MLYTFKYNFLKKHLENLNNISPLQIVMIIPWHNIFIKSAWILIIFFTNLTHRYQQSFEMTTCLADTIFLKISLVI